MTKDFEICFCLGTHKLELEKTIRDCKLTCIDEVIENGIAATYCGRCIPDIEIILDEMYKNNIKRYLK